MRDIRVSQAGALKASCSARSESERYRFRSVREAGSVLNFSNARPEPPSFLGQLRNHLSLAPEHPRVQDD